MQLTCHHPYLRRLWVKIHNTASSLHLVNDFECYQFSEQTLVYTQTLRDTLHECTEWSEPCDSWWHTWATLFQPDMVINTHIVQGIKDPELQERVSKLLETDTSSEDVLKKLQELYRTLEKELSILGEISKVSHLPYDPKPEQVVKLLETLERRFDKLNPGVLTELRKLMELSSKINDKLFVEWTKDNNLFARMHSYGSLKDLMKERAQLSVGLKHLAASRGSASGRTASSRYQEEQRHKEKETSFSGGPSSGSSAPKADISEFLS